MKRTIVRREALLALLLVATFVVVGQQYPRFAGFSNITNLLWDTVPVGIIAVGMAIVIIGGGIDISVGSIFVASAIMAGLVARDVGNPVLSALTGIIGGGVLGAINAGLITKFKIPPIVATLATMSLFRGVMTELTKSQIIDHLQGSFMAIGRSKSLGVPTPVWVMFAVFIVVALAMHFTGFGRVIYSVGGNERAVRLSGIRVERYQALTYVISGVLAGIAGTLSVARTGTVTPVAGTGLELLVIGAVVVGGTSIFGGEGTILGVALAAVLLQTIRSALVVLGIDPAWQDAIVGIVIIVAVSIFVIGQRRRERMVSRT